MEQISLKKDATKKSISLPASKAKFDIPVVEDIVEKIDNDNGEDEEEEIPVLAALLLFLGIVRKKGKEAASRNEAKLAAEMELIHPKEQRGGCGCGM